MGRPEKPVDHTMPALTALAEHLRSLRSAAGLTYQELADVTNYSPAQLKRAASGATLPTFSVVRAYAVGCTQTANDGAERASALSYALTLHREASNVIHSARSAARRSTIVPKPEYVRDKADLSGALRDAWARAGRPSMRSMEARAEGQLPRSSAHAICAGRSVPRDFRQFVAFLDVCEVSGTALGPWFRAWFKLFGRPKEKAVADALRFLHDCDERRVFLDVYVEGAQSPERSREELGLVAQLTDTMNAHERAMAAVRYGLVDPQTAARARHLLKDRDVEATEALGNWPVYLSASGEDSPVGRFRRELVRALKQSSRPIPADTQHAIELLHTYTG